MSEYVSGNTYAITSQNEVIKQLPWKLSVYAIIVLAVSSCTLEAAEYVLPEVNVEGKQPVDKTTDTVIGTKNVTTSSDIQLFDSAELISPYKAISREPGVDILLMTLSAWTLPTKSAVNRIVISEKL